MDYIFRVKFGNEKKFVAINESELNWRTFVDKGRNIFIFFFNGRSFVHLFGKLNIDFAFALIVFNSSFNVWSQNYGKEYCLFD